MNDDEYANEPKDDDKRQSDQSPRITTPQRVPRMQRTRGTRTSRCLLPIRRSANLSGGHMEDT